jgi:hypothetical protein
MILTGIVGLCLVAILWVLLYAYFIRRTDRFMENWEKEIKAKIEKATIEGMQPFEEAAEAIKTSRKAMEKFAYERGFIPPPPLNEISAPKLITEPQLETMPNSSSSFQFDPYPARKRKERENWSPSFIRLAPSPI